MHRPLERDVLLACLQLLKLAGVTAFRANTGAVSMPGRDGKSRFVRFGPKGQADILGLLPPSGRFLAVECKRPGGKARPEQVAFLDAVTRAGGLALIISDIKDLERALKMEGVM